MNPKCHKEACEFVKAKSYGIHPYSNGIILKATPRACANNKSDGINTCYQQYHRRSTLEGYSLFCNLPHNMYNHFRLTHVLLSDSVFCNALTNKNIININRLKYKLTCNLILRC